VKVLVLRNNIHEGPGILSGLLDERDIVTDIVKYGKRWKIEGVFSSMKRIFGESVRANSKEGMLREAMMKFNAIICSSQWLNER
jgi:hypothetical protein